MIVGITGGTGCGKTTALQAVRALGGLTLDCDEIYHELLKKDEDLRSAIARRFPEAFKAGSFDRKGLGKLVFSSPDALQDLNAITHAAVKREVVFRLQALQGRHAAIDAIALFESGLATLCDKTVAVIAPREERIARLMAREGISADYARARIAAQKPEGYFRENCMAILENSGGKEAFFERCKAFFAELFSGAHIDCHASRRTGSQ